MKDKNVKRLWNTNTKKFIEEFVILQTVNSDGNIEHTYFERNPKTLELERLSTCHIEEINCSGLKDKNGKLIYEGDIIKDELGYIRVCVYEDDRYRYPALKTSRYFHKAIKNKQKNRCEGLLSRLTFQDNLSKNSKSEFEIVGNIYDNQELLKEVK